MALATEILQDEQSLMELGEQWDGLAVQADRPYCSPAWMLSWWRNMRPQGAEMRVVVATEGARLVGVAPLWAVDGEATWSRYEVLAGRLSSPVGPVSLPGRVGETAEAFSKVLARMRPRPLLFTLEDLSGPSGWTHRLAQSWPAREPWVLKSTPRPLPVVSVEHSEYESWLAEKSSKFRQEARRRRRRLDERGARFSVATSENLEQALRAFADLHESRWVDRGGSAALAPGLHEMLVDVGRELLSDNRLRVYLLEIDSSIVAVNIMLAAGGEVSGWNTGFDASWAHLAPSSQLALHAIEDAIQRDFTRMSLGAGGTDYKLRLASKQEEVSKTRLAPVGAAYPLVRLRLAPTQARIAVSRRLPPSVKQRLRRLSRR